MLVVVVDTSTAAVTAALIDIPAEGATSGSAAGSAAGPAEAAASGSAPPVELVAHRRTIDARAHGELLAPAIAGVLAEAGRSAGDVAAIVAGVGPGPFTGLRVGLATAAAMAQALAIPTYGVCSLDGIGAETSGRCLVATDARRKEIYWAVYDDGVRITDPGVIRPDEVVPLLRTLDLVPASAAGDGARQYAETLEVPVVDGVRFPSPTALARLAAGRVRAGAPTERLTPMYLRRPDAVEPSMRKQVTP